MKGFGLGGILEVGLSWRVGRRPWARFQAELSPEPRPSSGKVALLGFPDGVRIKPEVKLKSNNASLSLRRIFIWPDLLRWFQSGILDADQAHGWATMLFAHCGVKVSRRQIFCVWLMGPPLHEEAIAHAQEQAHDEHAGRESNPAPVVVMRDVQALMQAVFDAAETGSVELQPALGVQFPRFRAAQQGDVLVLAPVALAQQAGGLSH
jgi:hypothetical protein